MEERKPRLRLVRSQNFAGCLSSVAGDGWFSCYCFIYVLKLNIHINIFVLDIIHRFYNIA